ncbi:MAG: SLOG family protein [bacterium]
MILSVIGSRHFNDYPYLSKKLYYIKNIYNIDFFVSGGANGADKLGEKWADENNIKKKIYYPNWKIYGKKAGFIRNKDIIENSDIVVAFWDHKSKGTKHSIDLANKNNKKIFIFHTDKTIDRKIKIKKILRQIKLLNNSLFR